MTETNYNPLNKKRIHEPTLKNMTESCSLKCQLINVNEMTDDHYFATTVVTNNWFRQDSSIDAKTRDCLYSQNISPQITGGILLYPSDPS